MELFDSFVRDFTRKPSQDVNSDDHHDGGSYYYEFIINYFHGGFHSEHAPPPPHSKEINAKGNRKIRRTLSVTEFPELRMMSMMSSREDVSTLRRLTSRSRSPGRRPVSSGLLPVTGSAKITVRLMALKSFQFHQFNVIW